MNHVKIYYRNLSRTMVLDPHHYVDDNTFHMNAVSMVECYKSLKKEGKKHVYRTGNKGGGKYINVSQ